jgi:GTP-binding protein LepA
VAGQPDQYAGSRDIEYMEEPIVKATILTPKVYVGNIMELCQDRRASIRTLNIWTPAGHCSITKCR